MGNLGFNPLAIEHEDRLLLYFIAKECGKLRMGSVIETGFAGVSGQFSLRRKEK